MDNQPFINKKKERLIVASSLAAAGTVVSVPAFAQSTDPLEDLASTLTTVGTIGGSAVSIILLGLGVRLGIKQVNRIMTKG